MKEFVKKFLLLALSLGLCLAIGEVFVRVCYPQQLVVMNPQAIWRYDDLTGWYLTGNADSKVNTGEGPVHFVTDADGHRIPRGWAENPRPAEGTAKIIAIGDSFIEALQVECEDTIPQVLAGLLTEKTGLRVTATNDGVSDWNPNQYYYETKRALRREKYDLGFVFIYIGNDLVDKIEASFEEKAKAMQHPLRMPKNLSPYELVDSLLYPLNNFLERRSQLFVFVKYRMQFILTRVGLTANYFPEIFLKSEKGSPKWRIQTEICEKIRDEFQNQNTPVTFVFLPAVYQVQQDDFHSFLRNFNIPFDSVDLEQPNRMLAALFKEKSLAFIDPLEAMRKQAKNGALLYGKTDAHLTRAGHRVVAETIIDSMPADMWKEKLAPK
ncbi:MAG: hypothetical protein PHN49_11295 [Candidatus Omnitrophica bacterium]|nr:hypothetical protein [Candidatus Omnitrophota bacterium]MDD5672214.1 hypothetical protein [Candidatus Omnitrophota bacterium]